MSFPKSSLSAFELGKGEYVFGRDMGEGVVLFAQGEHITNAEVYLREYDRKLDVLPFDSDFSRRKKLTSSLRGIKYFPQESSCALSMYCGYSDFGFNFEIYTFLNRKEDSLNVETIKFYDNELEQLLTGNPFNLDLGSNLGERNYFFQGNTFRRDLSAIKEFDKIKKRRDLQILPDLS